MNTTIAISNELKEKLRNLGKAGDSFDEIISRMYGIVRENFLLYYLYDESDSVSIDVAIAEARKKWPKSS